MRPNRSSVEGAIVIFSSIDGQKIIYKSTNNIGETEVPQIGFPIIRRIDCLGYEAVVDTFNHPDNEKREILLVPINRVMDEVTITGSLMPSFQSNSVYSIKVITRDEIDKKAANNLKDLLATELNLEVSNDAILGSGLNIQGIGGQNIKFLLDGVPVVGRQNGNIDLTELNLSNIDRVELVKGPMSVIYGTDALAGVVNLISKTNAKQKLSVGINTYYESNGQYNLDGSIGWGLKKSSFTISGGRNYFDGWNDPSDERYRAQTWKPKEQYFSNVKFIHSFNGWKMIFISDYSTDKITDKGEPIITPYTAKAFDHYYTTWRFNNQLTFNKKISEASDFQIIGSYSFYNHIRNSYVMDMVNLSEQLITGELDNDTTKYKSIFGRANYSNQKVSKYFSFLGGVEYNYELAKGARIDNSEHNVTDFSGYGSLEYKPLSSLSIRPAFRIIYNSNFDSPIIPSLNVLYKPFQFTEVRLSLSKGFRAPSLKEQFLDFEDSNHNIHGNSDLKPEDSNHFLASITLKKAFQKTVISIEPSLFYNQINNRISLVETESISKLFTYSNIDQFNSKGTEMALKFNKSDFMLSLAGAYTGVSESFNGLNKQSDIAWYAEYNALVSYTITKINTGISLQWKAIGNKPVYKLNLDNTISKYENDPYQLLDINVSKKIIKDRIAITVGVKNILDVKQVKSYDNNEVHTTGGSETLIGTGTSYFAKISILL